jgi:hypothetical protein
MFDTEELKPAEAIIHLVIPCVMEHVSLQSWHCMLGAVIPYWVHRSTLRDNQNKWFVRTADGKVVILSEEAYKLLFSEADTGVYE